MRTFEIGQRVWVYSFGHWYAGTVTVVGARRVSVEYTTGTGTTRDKPYNRDSPKVATERPARGVIKR